MNYSPINMAANPNNPNTFGLLGYPAQQIAGDLDAQRTSIMNSLPAGGERNLAMADATNQSYGNLANLRGGMVNQALSNIGSISSMKKYGVPSTGNSGAAGNMLSAYTSMLGNNQQYQLGLKNLQANQNNSSRSMWGSIIGSVAPVLLGAILASDERLKEEVRPFTRGLLDLAKINPVAYQYNGKGETKKGEKMISVLAQELKDAIPEAVSTVSTDDFADTHMIQPMGLLMTAINSIKELDSKVKKLERKKHGNS